MAASVPRSGSLCGQNLQGISTAINTFDSCWGTLTNNLYFVLTKYGIGSARYSTMSYPCRRQYRTTKVCARNLERNPLLTYTAEALQSVRWNETSCSSAAPGRNTRREEERDVSPARYSHLERKRDELVCIYGEMLAQPYMQVV